MLRALVAIALWAGGVEAQPAMPDRTERVVGAARLWAKAKFFHPYLAYKDIDWDAAFVKALPKIEAATTIAQYRSALDGMLAALGDPVTRIGAPAPAAVTPGTAATSWPAPTVLFVDLGAFVAGGFDARGFQKRGLEIEQLSAKAKTLVVDVRSSEPAWIALSAVAYFAGAFPPVEQWPLERHVEHRGYRSQDDGGSRSYASMFITDGAKPAGKPRATGPQHVVFITDERSPLPNEAIALQATGRATIVSNGPLDPAGSVGTVDVALPGELTATLRLGESLWGPPTADVIAPDPRARALALVKTLVPKARVPKQIELPPLRVRDDADYADTIYPSRELRVLAAVRVWATIGTFSPYRYLIPDWDAVFRELLPKVEAAPDRTAYIDALREMGVRTGDGHVGVAVAVPDPKMAPRGTVGAYLRWIEGKAVVLRTVDEPAQHALAVGDVIEAVDGKPVAQVFADKKKLTSGSTEAPREQRIVRDLAFGDAGTIAKLSVRDAKGRLRVVELPRVAANLKAVFDPPEGPHWRRLPNNVGYVSLMQLTVPEIAPMFAELAKTRGIVFDLRGYPNGTAWGLAARLNVKHAKYGAQFLRPLVDGDSDDNRLRFFQPIGELPKDTPLYTGKVVVLIDDRAVSQSEHTCLFLSEAAGATFVGSTTHGANGDITAMRLPGALRMWFTGQEVRWVDGRQLQRIGIPPHIRVMPTVRGIRAGKDEVLDRGVSAILSGKP